MACRNSRVRSGLLCLTLALFVAHAWGAETRQWTDNNGQTMLGTFVRVSGNKAVLKRGSRVIQVPLNSLSQIDRDYIESLNTNNDTKIWIVNRRKLRGSFHEYKDGVVSISFGARTRDYPINALSVEDRNHIRGLLEKDGKLAGLASTDPLKFRGSRPRTANVATDVEHQSRTWVNDKGKEVEATFVRVDGDDAILRREKGGKEIPFPLERLSLADRKHIQDIQAGAQVAAKPSQPTTRSTPPPSRVASRPTPSSRSTSAYRGASQPTRPRSNYGGPSVDPGMQATRMQERMAEQHRRSQASLEAMSKAHSAAASSTQRMQTQEYKTCSKCKRTISKDIGAGDNCPHCGVFFEYAVNNDGTREYASLARRRGRQAAGVVYSLGTLMIFIGGIIFIKRKIFG